MLSKRVVLLVVALSCLFALIPSALYSQGSGAGTVGGLITDSSGGAVASATITLTDKAKNTPRKTNENEAGRYFFANVTPGMYDVKVTMKGFRQSSVPAQEVVVGQTLTVNVTLEVGSMSEIVEVKVAVGAELQT